MEKKICKNSRKMKNFKKWISFLEHILKKLEYIQSLNQNENIFLLSYCTVVYV